ncbi:Pkinase-domain-containing protein [Rhodotorula sp. JG-1b]|nr:Pkinase-domain-containing protein [Rhodotorula sp. JG-1b]
MATTAPFPYSPPGDLTSTPPTSYEPANHLHQPQVKQQQQNNGSAESRYSSPPLGSSSPPQIPLPSITTAPARAPPPSAAPLSATRSKSAYDASLVIPPFNPNKRRSAGANSTATSSTSLETASYSSAGTSNPPPSQQAHPQQQQQLQQQQQALASTPAHATLPQRPVSFMPGYPSSSAAAATGQHAYLSASVGPGATAPNSMQFQQQQPYVQPGQEGTMAASVGPGGSVSSRSRQSVGYLPSSSSTASLAGQGPYPHLYMPHPMPRQKVYFGPYILLQTLGEGEFGKVKLGVHSERWGEDVAIKLIKRGNVDTVQRGEKVRREIEVLKMVRHPNIVRLYDVIETEKYIGIVLEYASGGELFDHILAHRYLKERDASRLFAQLISGVSYLHAKGVVHRDLKLENLLLDRNRNVIITDFGFANRFRDERVDLMATSCGSPCYAAPELVVQDGKYVGTAVDVWSCGVILYAMLAGYLPYDDDPNNPEGDNINLLYKYILNTPLVFPEWISEEPRHLLLMMLVADPEQRCTIRDVTQHPWLSRYAPAFDKSVEELEFAAQEMERHKRQALEVQRQWLVQQQQQQLLAAQGLLAPSMTRSQTSASSMGAMGGATAPLASGSVVPAGTAMAPTTSQQRHRSAMVTSASSAAVSAPLPQHGFEPFAPSPPIKETPPLSPSNDEPARPADEQQQPRSRTGSNTSVSSASRRPVPIPSSANPKRRSGQYSVPSSPPTTQTEFVAARALPFSYEPATTVPASMATATATATPSSVPMIPSRSAPAAAPPTTEAEDADMLDRGASASASASATPLRRPSAAELEDEAASLAAAARRRKAAHRATVQLEYDGGAIAARRRGASREPSLPTSIEGTVAEDRLEVPTPERAPPSPDPSLGGVSISTTTETAPGEDVIMESVEEVPEPTVSLPPPVAAEQPAAVAPIAASVPFPSTSPAPSPVATPIPNQTVAALSPQSSSAARKRKSSGSPVSSLHTEKALPPARAHENENVPTPKTSAGTQASQSTNVDSIPSTTSRHRPTMSSDRFSIRSLLNGHAGPSDRAGRNPARVEATGTVAPPAVPSSDGPLDDVSNRRRSTRRQKALSLQPFRSSVNSKLPKQARANVEAAIAASRDRPSIDTAEAAAPTQPPPSTSDKRFNTDLEANWQQQASPVNPTPSGKAKAVMDWFRRRSTRHDTSALAPIAADSQRRERPLSSVYGSTASTTSTRSRMSTPVMVAPKERPQQATAVNESAPPLTPAQTASNSSATVPSAAPVQTSQVDGQEVPTISTRAASQPAAAAASAFSPAKLRFHQGALDKNAVTYRSPDEVFAEVKQVLWNMGVEMVLEGDYKIKCVRKSRKKALAASVNHGNFASMASPVNRRASVASTHSLTQSPSMGFRSFFGKKHAPSPLSTPSLNTASVFSTPTTPGSPAAQDQTDPLSSPMTTSVSQFSMLSLSSPQPMPVYGSDKSADAGDEVRFVVELTRVKNLDRLYCVDLKRMKGGPWSFKHVYDQLLDSLELGPVV